MSGGHDAETPIVVRRSARYRRGEPKRAFFLLAVAAFLLIAAVPSRAFACTVCANPSTTALADGSSRQTRHRLQLDFLVGITRAGDTQADDRRLELLYGFAPIPKLELSLAVPLLIRTIATRGAGEKTEPTPGDMEVAATGTLWSLHEGSFSEAFTLRGGIKLPTAPPERDVRGVLLSSALQPGCNSVTPDLSLSYSLHEKIWSFSGDGGLYFPISVRTAPHAGASIRSSALFEIAPSKYFALRAGVATRLDPSGELRSDVPDPNSGGFVGSIINEVDVKPVQRLELGVSLYSPVLQFLHGDQHVGTTFGAHVAIRL